MRNKIKTTASRASWNERKEVSREMKYENITKEGARNKGKELGRKYGSEEKEEKTKERKK